MKISPFFQYITAAKIRDSHRLPKCVNHRHARRLQESKFFQWMGHVAAQLKAWQPTAAFTLEQNR